MSSSSAAVHARGRSPLERWALPIVVALTLAGLVAAIAISRDDSQSAGIGAGQPAPEFSAVDVVSGETFTRSDLEGSRTLLFFSEGAACQACMVQIADLQKDPGLRAEGVQLVSVSTDPPETLASVAARYGVSTPLLSDSSREMSRDYGMLGKGGMGHPDTDGHAFMLLDAEGRIAWEQAYSEMYVPPATLLDEMGAAEVK